MKRERLAYLAGAIDSDGTIGIKRSTYGVRVLKNSKQPTYSERIALRQVTPQIPKMLKRAFGGSLYLMRPSAKNGRPLWAWQVSDVKALAAARALLPHLRVKRSQAINLIGLRKVKDASRAWRIRCGRGHVGGSPRHGRHSLAMEARYLRAKRLNRVGT